MDKTLAILAIWLCQIFGNTTKRDAHNFISLESNQHWTNDLFTAISLAYLKLSGEFHTNEMDMSGKNKPHSNATVMVQQHIISDW